MFASLVLPANTPQLSWPWIEPTLRDSKSSVKRTTAPALIVPAANKAAPHTPTSSSFIAILLFRFTFEQWRNQSAVSLQILTYLQNLIFLRTCRGSAHKWRGEKS